MLSPRLFRAGAPQETGDLLISSLDRPAEGRPSPFIGEVHPRAGPDEVVDEFCVALARRQHQRGEAGFQRRVRPEAVGQKGADEIAAAPLARPRHLRFEFLAWAGKVRACRTTRMRAGPEGSGFARLGPTSAGGRATCWARISCGRRRTVFFRREGSAGRTACGRGGVVGGTDIGRRRDRGAVPVGDARGLPRGRGRGRVPRCPEGRGRRTGLRGPHGGGGVANRRGRRSPVSRSIIFRACAAWWPATG